MSIVKKVTGYTLLGLVGLSVFGAFTWWPHVTFLMSALSKVESMADVSELPGVIHDRWTDSWSDADKVAQDEFSRFIGETLAEGNTDALQSVTLDALLDSLATLHRTSEDKLLRYLATHPGWRLSGEPGQQKAIRRGVIDGSWKTSLNGYQRFADDYNVRQVIYWQAPTHLMSQGLEDRSFHQASDLTVEVAAEARSELRQAMLGYLDTEMTSLNVAEETSVYQQMKTRSYIRSGKPSLRVFRSFQPGLYDSHIWVNPGEPGRIYLKAFRILPDTPLSEDRLPGRTMEWIGWSNDQDDMFFSNSHFTIYEGDWGDYYAARFEVWFIPEGGSARRKLLEKDYIIEGWQR